MKTDIPLPGLERLLSADRKYGLQGRLRSPVSHLPGSGEPFLGRPFDPMLAAFYRRLGGLSFYLNLFIEPGNEHGILVENESVLPQWPEPFRSLLIFGSEEALAYRYATVPSLADEQGFQPVVMVDPYEDIHAVPIASNVDRFFEAYARYLELIQETPEFRDDHDARPPFPRGVPELIAADRTLVGMLVAGRFDFLMFQPAVQNRETHEELRQWIAELRAVSM